MNPGIITKDRDSVVCLWKNSTPLVLRNGEWETSSDVADEQYMLDSDLETLRKNYHLSISPEDMPEGSAQEAEWRPKSVEAVKENIRDMHNRLDTLEHHLDQEGDHNLRYQLSKLARIHEELESNINHHLVQNQ